LTVEIRETTFTANKANNDNNYANEIYTIGAPTIFIVNTLFNQPVDSNNNFYSSSATWNTCANNVCTDTPFTGTCTAVNNANAKYGVVCHYNNNYISKCSPGTSPIVGGAETGQVCIVCSTGTYQDETSQPTCKNCNPGTYNTEQGQTSISSCKPCEKGYQCPSTSKAQQDCGANLYQDEIGQTECKKCTGNKVSPRGSATCYDLSSMLQNVQSLSAQQGGIIKAVALSNAKSNEVKQKANGLIAKLSLDWATQDVINEAQRLRNQLSSLPEYNVKPHVL
jgi:hypothetical protein